MDYLFDITGFGQAKPASGNLPARSKACRLMFCLAFLPPTTHYSLKNDKASPDVM
jgi:hypothetical protein